MKRLILAATLCVFNPQITLAEPTATEALLSESNTCIMKSVYRLDDGISDPFSVGRIAANVCKEKTLNLSRQLSRDHGTPFSDTLEDLEKGAVNTAAQFVLEGRAISRKPVSK